MAADPPATRRSRWGWLRIPISLGLLAALALVIDVGETLSLLRATDPLLLALLLLVNTLAYVLFALRWGYFCTRLGLSRAFRDHLRGIYLFQVTSLVSPAPLLGEAGRLSAFAPGTSKTTILKSIALDRLSNQIALACCVTLLLPYYWSLDLPGWLRWLLPLPALVLGALVLFARHVGARHEGHAWLEKLSFLRLLTAERLGLVPLLLGLMLSCVLGLEFYVAATALPLSIPAPAALILLVPLLTLALTMMPISFGDWGTREIVALLVLASTGLASEDLVAISLLVGATNLVCALPGLWLVARGRRRREGAD